MRGQAILFPSEQQRWKGEGLQVVQRILWSILHAIHFQIPSLSIAKFTEALPTAETLHPMKEIIDGASSRLMCEDESDHTIRNEVVVHSHQMLDASHDESQMEGAVIDEHSDGLGHPPRDQKHLLKPQQLQQLEQVYPRHAIQRSVHQTLHANYTAHTYKQRHLFLQFFMLPQSQHKLGGPLRMPNIYDLFLVGFLKYPLNDSWLVEQDQVINVIVMVLAWSLGQPIATVVPYPYIVSLRCQQVRQAVASILNRRVLLGCQEPRGCAFQQAVHDDHGIRLIWIG